MAWGIGDTNVGWIDGIQEEQNSQIENFAPHVQEFQNMNRQTTLLPLPWEVGSDQPQLFVGNF